MKQAAPAASTARSVTRERALRPSLAGATALLMLVGVVSLASCRRREAPPAVILVSFDTLRADRLNAYGYQKRRVSPAIDRFARDSVLFRNATAPSPWTTPSHLSLLTALTPLNHGVTTPYFDLIQQLNRRRLVETLSPANVTLAEALRDAGYATAAFTGGVTLDSTIGFAQGFDVYETSMFKLTDAAMARMLDWVDGQRQRPFFLFWHTFETHDPYHALDFLPEVAKGDELNDVQRNLIELIARFYDQLPIEDTRRRLDAIVATRPEMTHALYDGGVAAADRRFGQLVARLLELGRYDNTVLILTSDHGEELGERGPLGVFGRHGHSLYQECLSVPLVIKLPRQRHAGAQVATLASLIDVMPTVLDILGVPLGDHVVEGRTLRPAWEGRRLDDRFVVSDSLATPYEQKSVRSERWKYIVTIPAEQVERHGRRHLPEGARRAELYDLQTDPGERRNLLASDDRAGVSRSVAARLDALLRRHFETPLDSAAPTKGTISEEALERLRALGYVQ